MCCKESQVYNQAPTHVTKKGKCIIRLHHMVILLIICVIHTNTGHIGVASAPVLATAFVQMRASLGNAQGAYLRKHNSIGCVMNIAGTTACPNNVMLHSGLLLIQVLAA